MPENLIPQNLDLESILFFYLGVVATGFIALILYSTHLAGKHRRLKIENESLRNHLASLQEQLAIFHAKQAEKGNITNIDDLLNAMDFGMVVVNQTGQVNNLNNFVAERVRMRKMDVINKSLDKMLDLRDGNNNKINIDYTNPSKSIVRLPSPTYWNLTEDNRVEVSATYQKFGIGSIFFTLITLQDLSDTMKNLSETKEKLRELTNKIQNMDTAQKLSVALSEDAGFNIMFINPEGNITYINPQAGRFFNVTEKEAAGKQYREFLYMTDTKDAPEFSAIEVALTQKIGNLPKWTFIHHRNTKTPVTGQAIPLYSDNKPIGIGLIFYDASEDYRTEMEDKAFFSGAAHDLRSPLTAIRGVLELLESEIDKITTEKRQELIAGAKESTLHLLDLVNNLLNVSRIELDRITVKKEAFEIVPLITDTINSYKKMAEDKKLYINQETSIPVTTKVYADKTKVQEIINNLVSNSLKYTPRGGIKISYSLQDVTLGVLVNDTGLGISPENQTLLFRKFQQLGAARNLPLTTSSGLGLYISKKFADLMGCQLALVSSEPDVGSTFKLTLPITT